MSPSKIYASASHDQENGSSNEDESVERLYKKSTSFQSNDVFPRWRQLYLRVLSTYNRLSWTTQQTIQVLVSLSSLLYLLFSVPFRIGFLYDPFDAAIEEQKRWTPELTFFTTLDVFVDIIGAIECVNSYKLWRNGISYQTEAHNYEKRVNRRRDRIETYPGKDKWTIASIGQSSSPHDKELQSFITRNWGFAAEIIALIPFEVFSLGTGTFNTLHLVRVTKLCRLYQLQHRFRRLSTIYSDRVWVQRLSAAGVNSLVHTIGWCAGMSHWVACGYMLIAHTQCGLSLQGCDPRVETSWVVRDRLLGATITRKYGRTLYWATRTMVLLGYDDVTPVSTVETIYVIVVQLFGALFSSSMLANFLFIFRFRYARYAEYLEHVDNAREYMHSKNIPRSVRHQVIAYLSYSWNTHHSLDSEEALHLMPKYLQSKVTATLKGGRIEQVCFLAKENVEFVNSLALALEKRVYSPGDRIMEPKMKAQMFFVIRGNVVLSNFTGGDPRECVNGEYFGEICLLFPEQFIEKAVAKTFCELYVLAKDKFDQVVIELHRGHEAIKLAQMAEIFEKFATQQLKMQKLLGKVNRKGDSTHVISRRTSGYQTGKVKLSKETSWKVPDSSFRVHWSSFRLLAVIYVAFEVPYHAVFVSMIEGENMLLQSPLITLRFIGSILVEFFFAVDICLQAKYFAFEDPLSFLTVNNPTLIFAEYRANGFYLDLLAEFPIGLIVDFLPTRSLLGYSWIFRLPRLLRMRMLPSLLRNLRDLHNISSKIYLFISLLLAITLTLHIVGIVWFEMAWIPRHHQSGHQGSVVLSSITRAECLREATLYGNCSWVKFDCYGQIGTVFPTEDSSSIYTSSFSYIRSMYWAVVALTAVGYGDIVAFSTAESFFAAAWIFVAGITNFAVIGAMSSTISNAMATRHHHLNLLNTVNSIMGRLNISDHLSIEIRRFYNNQFKDRKLAYESQLLANLPDQLSYQISSLLHANAVKRVSLFDAASANFIAEVTGKFRHRTYETGEIICFEGEICREFLVLLHKSKVNVFFRSKKVPARALQGGDCYGVYEFLLRRAHSVTLVATSTVHASVMTRKQFDAIQHKFEDDLREMKAEAQILWTEQHLLLVRIAKNLENLKLKTHVLQTSTLFYQKEIASHSGNLMRKRSIRDICTSRSMIFAIWRAVGMGWNVYNAFFVMFRIGFHSHLHFSRETNVMVWIADLCGDLFFAMDIYLKVYYFGNLEIGFDNLFHCNWRNQHFLQSTRFKWDLVASLPLYLPAASGTLIVSVCRLPRLIRCLDLWGYLDDVIVHLQQHFTNRKVSAYLGPIKLMIIVAFAAHFVGSIFILNTDHECETNNNCWLRHDILINKYDRALWMIYIKAMYWAITTLLLTSSRDIAPRNLIGTIWVIITCLSCTFAMGYVVGEITDLILGLNKELKQHKTRIANFESFAKNHSFSESLRDRARFFFRAQFESTDGYDVPHVLHQLPSKLRIEFLLEIYGHALHCLPITHFLSSSQISNLALRLQPELFIPGDKILVEGTLGNSLCTLHKGIAAAFWTKSVASVAVITEGALFGEVAFFLPTQRRLVSVRATTTCEVLYVSKHDWEELWTATDDQGDSREQKYALYSILTWVNDRIQRYRRQSIRVAIKARRELDSRQKAEKSYNNTAESKTKSSSSMKPIGLRKDIPKPISLPLDPSQKSTSMQSIVPPEVHILEKKTKYLLAKSKKCSKQLEDAIEDIRDQYSRRSTGHSSRKSVNQNVSNRKFFVSPPKSNLNDITYGQFIMNLNPINKYLRTLLTDQDIEYLESEGWWRAKILSAIQYSANETLESLDTSGSRNYVALVQFRQISSSSVLEKSRFKNNSKNKRKIHAISSKAKHQQVVTNKFNSRRVSTGWVVKPDENIERQQTLERMKRCQSLPLFQGPYFDEIQNLEIKRQLVDEEFSSLKAEMDFKVLQRYQRPQYESQIQIYHHYRVWMGVNQTDNLKKEHRKPNRLSLDLNFNVGNLRRITTKVTAHQNQFLSRHHSLHIEMNDSKTRKFIHLLKSLGNIWDAIMLFAAVYYTLISPFKACFPHDLSKFSNSNLRNWTHFDFFLDFLCLVDICYKIHQIVFAVHGKVTCASIKSTIFCRFVAVHFDLLTDIAAILPLELILLDTNIRAPVSYQSSPDTVWWTTCWLLRINRMLFARRIQPLSESLLQFIIFDCNLNVNESTVAFFRALLSYLLMAHFLACLWFATSNYSMYQFDISWLSSSGMLTFIAPLASRSMKDLTKIVEATPLSRKYLRSLLFSTECITTLFYGDVVSMNEIELIAEVTITIWCTYLYGALAGAQSELLDSQVKCEAIFEQNLAELQLYLIENEAPKELRTQVKTYFAHMWHRSRGKSDFAAIEGVARGLQEDFVLATLREFAVRVEAFRDLEEPFLRALLVCLQYAIFSTGEEVVVAGDLDRSMYFIAQGQVLVRSEAAEITLERGQYFGELALLYGIPRLASCIALTTAELYRLDHELYERVLAHYPEYRTRVKLAWTTSAKKKFSGGKAATGVSKKYRISIELLAQLQEMKPRDAKEFFFKCRAGGFAKYNSQLSQTADQNHA